MASTPAFVAAPGRSAAISVSTANTARDGTGTIVDILTGASGGTKIERIKVISTADPADSIVNIFRHNGTSYFFWDSFDLGNPAAASATADVFSIERAYGLLLLPSASWKLAASITAAPTAGVVNVFADGGDF